MLDDRTMSNHNLPQIHKRRNPRFVREYDTILERAVNGYSTPKTEELVLDVIHMTPKHSSHKASVADDLTNLYGIQGFRSLESDNSRVKRTLAVFSPKHKCKVQTKK